MKRKGRAIRRKRTAAKLLQRAEMMRCHGQMGGCIYEKHRNKIDHSLGYMRDGNVSHFVRVGFGNKTRDRNRYGAEIIWSRHDGRAAQAAEQQLREYRRYE
jgi:hypothetical protein